MGLFLVGSFDSMAGLAKTKYGFIPHFVLRYKFNNIKLVRKIDVKTYIFASKADKITYIQNARVLKNHTKNLALYKELDGLNHKEILWDDTVINEINRVIL
jgi:GTP-binding protein EngB required for normal cell division